MNQIKLVTIGIFFLLGVAFLSGGGGSTEGASGVAPTPTPALIAAAAASPTQTPAAAALNVNAPVNANSSLANTNTGSPANFKPSANAATKTIRDRFTLSNNGLQDGEPVTFSHKLHASETFSADGKSVIGCVECHHTDQPKGLLKPPLVTSERNELLTDKSWLASTQQVTECRVCHFEFKDLDELKEQGKVIPSVERIVDGEKITIELHSKGAYHDNCIGCHVLAEKDKNRPRGYKFRQGFSTACAGCHIP